MSFLVNTRRMSFADFWRERTWWNLPLLFLFYFLTRLVNVQAPAFGEFPAVGRLSRHRVEAEHWPDFAADILQAAIQRMSATRWTPWGSFGVETSSKNAAFFGQTFLDPDGKTLAVVSHRFYPNSTAKERRPSTVFFSKLSDGTVIVSSTGVPDLVPPPTWRIDYRRDDGADDLIAWHNQRCREIAGVRRLEPITRLGGDGVQVTESLLQEYLEFQINRGVITESNEMLVTAVAGSTPEPAWETPQVIDADDHNEPVIAATLVESEDNVEPQDNVDSRDPMDSQSPAEQSLANLMHEIRQQETKQSGWVSKVFILGLSLLVFIWLGALNWDLQFVLLLVPILLVHELGHFIAMRCLGYRDVRMFFIPLLGAAVTGRQYGISGWKKGLVSLAGPLPSIVMGAGLAALAVHYQSEFLQQAAFLTLLLNVFNLIPILPLDGGWIAHLTVFSRSMVLDMVFRVLAVVGMMAFAVLIGGTALIAFAVILAIGLPAAYRLLSATRDARQIAFPPAEDGHIPVGAVREILPLMARHRMVAPNPTTKAQQVLQIYENAIARPPSLPASLGLWLLHLGGIVLGIGAAIAMFAAPRLMDIANDGMGIEPEYEEIVVEIPIESKPEFRLGTDDAEHHGLLLWEFESTGDAQTHFETQKLASSDTVLRIENLVLQAPDHQSLHHLAEDESAAAQDDPMDVMIQIEKTQRESKLLDTAFSTVHQRQFTSNEFQLRLQFKDPAGAEKFTQSIRRYGTNIYSAPLIRPWTPRSKISADQETCLDRWVEIEDLRQQANRQWSKAWQAQRSREKKTPEQGDADLRPDAVLQSVNSRLEAMLTARLEGLDGVSRSFWESVIAHERALDEAGKKLREMEARMVQAIASGEEWDDENIQKEYPYPDYAEGLSDTQRSRFGILSPSDARIRFSVNADAYPSEGSRSEVTLYMDYTQDPVAALAGMLAWLRKQEVESIQLCYERIAIAK